MIDPTWNKLTQPWKVFDLQSVIESQNFVNKTTTPITVNITEAANITISKLNLAV